MKTFNEYVTENFSDKMSPEKSVKILEKTAVSISNHMRRNGYARSRRADDLYNRYEDHSDFLRQHHRAHWLAYCKRKGADPSHTAADMFA